MADGEVNDFVAWLNNFANEDDVIAGADYVGNAGGTRGTDWDVYDEAQLCQFIQDL